MNEPNDLQTRVALLELSFKSDVVTRDKLADREDRMVERLEKMIASHERRMADTLDHAMKVFGHSTAEQMHALHERIKKERADEILAALQSTQPPKGKADLLQRWGLPLGVAAIIGGPGTVVQLMNIINALM